MPTEGRIDNLAKFERKLLKSCLLPASVSPPWFFFALFYPALAQDGVAPKDGALNTYLAREPNDTNGQLALMMQGMYQEQLDVTVVQFLLLYGSRIHMDRTYFPANTSDHEMIPGYVFTPAAMPKGTRRPGLVMVHGGFHEKLDWRFSPELIDEAVSHGYAVIFPEYRGSTGYGETVYTNSYGVTDVADVLAAADYIAKKDFVDPARIGIIGHSRGGMTTLLALEKGPKRFRVAVEILRLDGFCRLHELQTGCAPHGSRERKRIRRKTAGAGITFQRIWKSLR